MRTFNVYMSTGACNLSPDTRLTWKISRQNNPVSGFNWNYPDTLVSKVSYWEYWVLLAII